MEVPKLDMVVSKGTAMVCALLLPNTYLPNLAQRSVRSCHHSAVPQEQDLVRKLLDAVVVRDHYRAHAAFTAQGLEHLHDE